MIRMQDFGEIAYGGAVTIAEWWDDKRITAGTLATKDIWKKASFYTYLGIGLPATLMSAFGWWRQMEKWGEHISHGFLYDMPRFIYNIVKAMGAASSGADSKAIRQAQEILARKKAAVALPPGRGSVPSRQPAGATVGLEF